MKRLSILMALCAATILGMATFTAVAQADQSQSGTSDPNMRWHNGKWWYWQTSQNRWMVWNGSDWQAHRPNRATRSYSYMQDDINDSGFRGTTSRSRSSGGRITNSGGIRDAGSKVRGNY